MTTNRNSLRRLFLGGVAFGALSLGYGAANAQEAADTPVEIVPAAEAEQPSGDRVVVTGSRIARDAFSSASPIQVITSEGAVLEGLVDTAELLQGSTSAAGSTQYNNSFGGFVIEGGPGINSISLRGLGAQRSLVLVNGRRPGPAGVRGQVGSFDLNVIPDSIIDRVEILKDGASSIYGSDAVAGVANLITRSSVDRPEITVQFNQPTEGGGETFQINGAFGKEWSNGNLVVAAEYESREALKWGDRSFLACGQDFIYSEATGQRIDRIDQSVLAGTSLGQCDNIYQNTVLVGANRYIPSPDGVTIGPIPGYRPRANGVLGGEISFYEDVLNNQKYLEGSAIAAVERTSIYAKNDMTFGSVDWATEALFTRREYEGRGHRQFFPSIVPNAFYDVAGPYDSPFGAVVARPVTIWESNDDVSIDYFYLTSGLSGGFGGNGLLSTWSWEANASYSVSDGSYTGNEIPWETAGDWFYPSADGLYHAPLYDPFDPDFLAGNYSDDVYNLLTTIETGNTTYTQTVFDAIVSGDLFDLPAGPFGFALGIEHRAFEIEDTPSANSQAGVLWGTSSADITAGKDNVTEIFGEVNVPILSGVPGFEELTFSGSARAFDYDSYGSDSVWKAGLNWQVVPSFRVRGSVGTSYRAPALYELYLGNQTAFAGQLAIDPCIDWGNSSSENIRTNCAAAGIPSDYAGAGSSATIISGGGAGVLEAETSDAQTFGVIFTPTALNLSIALDYFDITINDQVSRLGGGTIVGGCYALANYPNAFCNLFDRNPGDAATDPFNIGEVRDSYINVNEQSTRGIDLELRYEHEFDFGDLTVDLSATKTLEDINLLFDSAEESGFDTNDFNGTIGDPEFVGSPDFRLRRGDLTYSWFIDYIGEADNVPFYAGSDFTYFGVPATRINSTDAWLSHDVSLRWTQDNYTLTGGISNIFNAVPPVISDGGGQRVGNVALGGTQYGWRGRTLFARLTTRF